MKAIPFKTPRFFLPCSARPFSSLRIIDSHVARPLASSFHSTSPLSSRKRDNFSFSSKAPVVPSKDAPPIEEKPQSGKRKTRSSAAKNSLRRVAVEAQRSRDGKDHKKASTSTELTIPKVRIKVLNPHQLV